MIHENRSCALVGLFNRKNICGHCSYGDAICSILIYFQLKKISDQTHRLEKSIRNSTYQSIANAEMMLWQTTIASPKIIDEFYSNQLKLDRDTKKSIMIGLSFYENIFYQYEQGFFSAEMWVNWKKAIKDMGFIPQYMDVWKFMRPYYYPPFVTQVDNAIEEKRKG